MGDDVSESRDLGDLDEIDVEAIGEPGHRTFRLLLESGATTASLWVEKEQLEQLALIVSQQVARFSDEPPPRRPDSATLAARFPQQPTVDFKVGRIALGFDPEGQRFVFTAHPLRPAGQLGVSCVTSQAQAEALSAKILTIAAAGRPRCPLCGEPIEGKHVCPISNGHVHP